MSALKLPNYLRTQRKRVGFFQEELAFLLGCEYGTMVSRYEQFARLPTLKTALAYEVVFGTPVRELFAGSYEEIEKEVIERATLLTAKLQTSNPSPATARKLDHLRAIINGPAIIAENPLSG